MAKNDVSVHSFVESKSNPIFISISKLCNLWTKNEKVFQIGKKQTKHRTNPNNVRIFGQKVSLKASGKAIFGGKEDALPD